MNGTVPLEVTVDDEITIKGKLNANATSFSANFIMEQYDNILYHLKVEIKNGTVAQNSKQAKAGWGPELRVNVSQWLSQMRGDFTLAFRFHKEKIEVFKGTVNWYPHVRGDADSIQNVHWGLANFYKYLFCIQMILSQALRW